MTRIKRLERLEHTTLRLGGVGDNWHMTWASDDKQYAGLCDGSGWPGMPQAEYNSRLYGVAGVPPDVAFEFMPGYPELLTIVEGDLYSRYYNFGILAVDGTIYQFLSTPNVPFGRQEPRFVGAKLIFSTDNGRAWHNQDGSSPAVWEPWHERSRDNMLFFREPGEAFGLITVLQMGRNYELNRDGYVYLYSPNGNVEGTMNETVLSRVPKDRILDRSAYRFYAGPAPHGSARWSPAIEDRAPVHTFPPGWVNRMVHPYAWHPSVVYYPATDEYLMANWGMGCSPSGEWFGKPSYLGFWTAPEPWGAWTQVHEEAAWTPGNDLGARAYQPQIAPKWIAGDGRAFWLIWTDFQQKDGERPYYGFNMQQIVVTLG